jgi:hypothetical protein
LTHGIFPCYNISDKRKVVTGMNVKISIKEKRRKLMPRTLGWTGRRGVDISVP